VDKGACNEIRQDGFRGCSALTCSWWPTEHKTRGAGAGTRGAAQDYSTIAVIASSSAITEMRRRGRAISFASSTRDASGGREHKWRPSSFVEPHRVLNPGRKKFRTPAGNKGSREFREFRNFLLLLFFAFLFF
jgi:hypothetical protein